MSGYVKAADVSVTAGTVDARWWWAAVGLVCGEILTLSGAPLWEVGFVPISWSVLLAPIFVFVTAAWWPMSDRMARVDLVLLGASACAVTWFIGVLDDPKSAFALFIPSMTEELAYRVAGPALIAGLAVAAGLSRRRGMVLGMVMSSVLFTLMPGHLDQVTSLRGLAPFIAFSFLYTTVVWRTRNLVGAVLAHATMNLFTFPLQLSPDPALDSRISTVRALCVGLVTVIFVAGSYWARDTDESDASIEADDHDGVVEPNIVIDLRDLVETPVVADVTESPV